MEQVEFSLRKVTHINWFLLLVLCVGGVIFTTPHIATSILVGGAISNFSFGWLKKDLTRLFSGNLDGVKARFFIRYYIRFALLVLILFLLIKGDLVNNFGLLVGLSSVVLGILLTMIVETKKVFLNNVKEAS